MSRSLAHPTSRQTCPHPPWMASLHQAIAFHPSGLRVQRSHQLSSPPPPRHWWPESRLQMHHHLLCLLMRQPAFLLLLAFHQRLPCSFWPPAGLPSSQASWRKPWRFLAFPLLGHLLLRLFQSASSKRRADRRLARGLTLRASHLRPRNHLP